MIGNKFGEWFVIKEDGLKYGRKAYLCECKCGKRKTINGNELRRGKTTKCQKCSLLERNNYLGKSFVDYEEYIIWKGIKSRCSNIKDKNFDNYYGRGITVCDEWRNSFETFIEDMGLRPSREYTIERKDNNKGYSKSNCIWATMKVQNNNRRNRKSMFISFINEIEKYKVVIKGVFVGYYSAMEDAIIARDLFIDKNNIKNLRLKD